MSISYYPSSMFESALKLQLQFQRQMQPMYDTINMMQRSLQPVIEMMNGLQLQGIFQPNLTLMNQLQRILAPPESIQRLMEQSYRQQQFWSELLQSINTPNEPIFIEECTITELKEPVFSEKVVTYIHRCRNCISENTSIYIHKCKSYISNKCHNISFSDAITIFVFFTGYDFHDAVKFVSYWIKFLFNSLH